MAESRRKKGIMYEIEICNYWLDRYEAAGNSYCFDFWYCEREKLLKRLKEVE